MFAAAMKTINFTTTWNGAKSYATPVPKVVGETELENPKVEGLIKLFYKGIRGVDEEKLKEWFLLATSEDIEKAIILAFHIRDCRGGKGERNIGRVLFEVLSSVFPDIANKVVHLIPEYGRYDDWIYLLQSHDVHPSIKTTILSNIKQTLLDDIGKMNEGKPVSLLAKWLPSENSSADKNTNIVTTICHYLEISKTKYRKVYLTPLRKYLDIVETYMCKGDWVDINFDKVPSCAMKKLKNAFKKHTPETFNEWIEGLADGTRKVNAKQLFPYEIIKEVRELPYEKNQVTISQWNVLENELKTKGKLSKTLPVVDVSGSMFCNDCLPIDNACALGIIISSCVDGDFGNLVMTFTSKPKFCKIKGDDVYDKYNNIKHIEWGASTNLVGVFTEILDRAKEHKLKSDDMPERVIIISDMQFNQGVKGETNLETITSEYKTAGYKRPDLIYWNVAGDTSDYPATINDDGTCLISGFSPFILECIMDNKKINSVDIMYDTLNKERYDAIRKCLE